MIRSLLAQYPAGVMSLDIQASPVTTAAWTVVGTTPAPFDAVAIHNTSDSVLIFATGSPGQEVVLPIYAQACDESVPLPFALGKNVIISVKALQHNVSAGDLVLNLFK